MNATHLRTLFHRLGARLRVSAPPVLRPGVDARFRLDVDRDPDGPLFDLRLDPDRPVDLDVLDLRADLGQLLLRVELPADRYDPRHREARVLAGRDAERGWFASAMPAGVVAASVERARAALSPVPVLPQPGSYRLEPDAPPGPLLPLPPPREPAPRREAVLA